MLLQGFIAQCRLRPQACALQEGERRFSYLELYQRAQRLAGILQAKGVGPGSLVAIALERGIDASVAVFGTLLSGAAYLPLDLNSPPQRLAFICTDSGATLTLGNTAAPTWSCADRWLQLSASAEAEFKPTPIRPDALAAVLYTSGSTGQPRGVALSYSAIGAFADWATKLVNLGPGDRIAGSAPLFFDLSTFDLYAVLCAGACLCFVPPGLTLSPARLSAWLAQTGVTGWYTVPALLSFLAYKGNLADTPLPALRFLLFAGEAFSPPALIALSQALPRVELFNLFGPTETNVCCYWQVQRSRLQADQAIPIGVAAAGCSLHIEQDNGELWVRGPTLAKGYWQAGRLQPMLNSLGWYQTGDKVSRQHGELQFHGRLGRMLKCSGYRVEPAELEAAVCSVPGVAACAVVGLPDLTAGQRPAVAWVSAGADITAIREALSRRLPAYMQPSRFIRLDELPRLANGKLDYVGLTARFHADTLPKQPAG
ncbi:amino acid adenylation domain-containing protein [Methylomonas rhizoryzae]|uniref:amino acid adenylation domain-containing protein n=1 Tax=Methylomonas rhizoryzae TaxID=2608981 RepID=UPI0012321271|nr:amino acid adenylation domain-containing protein [Methylomonas rhizoryzae]